MRIDIVGKQLEITPAIREFTEGKSARLPKHFEGNVQRITWRLEERAHGKGFHAEVVVDVEHHDDFVANAEGPSLYAAIDEATDKAARQLTAFKERLKQNKRGGTSASGSR
ncbi:MAG: ribosome hibernation-promoting factor, HPF/YfiA family [Phycisphaerales bacterium]